jgi:hypothetical protein
MKLFLHAFACLLAVAIAPVDIVAQCSAGSTAFSMRYDTTVTGNGNSSRNFTMPKFDPSLGTLISVDLKSVVGLEYSYDLENQTAQTRPFKTKIVRTDDVYSTALDPSSINAVNQTPYVTTTIASHHQVSIGPSKMGYIVTNTVNDGRLVNFMGAGTVDFDYETGTSASVQGPLPWQLNFTSVKDTTNFSITYNYCSTSLLSAGLLYFSATPLKGKVALTWRQSVPEANRLYNLQMSTDGLQYSTLAAIKEDNSGNYNYTYLNNVSGKLYFRVQQVDASGSMKYSNTRIVAPEQQDNTARVRIYPTVYTGGSLLVSLPYNADWQISFYAADGRKITEQLPSNIYSAQLVLPSTLNNGVYTAEVINTKTRQKMVTRLIIQR